MPTTEAPATPEKVTMRFHFEPIELAPVTRAADGAAEPAEDPNAFEIVISTETPCATYMGDEVWSHAKGAVDMSLAKSGVSLYLEHGGYPYRISPDPGMHLGCVENIRLGDDRKQRGTMRFSEHELAQRVKRDVVNKTLKFVSARAKPLKRKIVRSADGDVPDQVIWTRWRLEEVSIVGIPADPNAVIRSAGSSAVELFDVETEYEGPVPTAAPPSAATPTATPAVPDSSTRTAPANATQEEPTMPDVITAPAAPAAQPAPTALATEPASVVRSAGAPPADLLRLCSAHGVSQARAIEFIEQGYSLERAKVAIFDERSTRNITSQPPAEVNLDAVPEKDRKEYSYARALQGMVAAKEGTGRFEGREAELSQEIARQTPATYRGVGGAFVPLDLRTREQRYEREAARVRAMGATVFGGGAELVFDRAMDLIDLLRNRMLCVRMGAQVLSGLTGPIQYPVQTGDPTAYYVGENAATGAPPSQLTFTTRTMSPKEAIAVVPFPRRLVNMSAFDIESRVRNSLIAKHALLDDHKAFHGLGTSGEPCGVYNTPGVQAVDFGNTVPTYAKWVEMGGVIADSNADTETMAYIMTPLMAAKMKTVLEAGAAGAKFIWTGTYRDGEVAGYRAGSTKQLLQTMGAGADHGAVFGDFSAMEFGNWNALEFIVDAITLADRGQIKITTNKLGDSLLTRPEAFAVATGARLA